MTLTRALSEAGRLLSEGNVEDASLESELLLRHTLKYDRVQLFLNLEQELSAEEEANFKVLINRRLDGEPSAYIIGHREFFGLDFIVTPDVLIPRPESELLVEKAIELAKKRSAATVAEIGTGSGVIVISLALNLQQTRIFATDISSSALKVAYLNCLKHGVSERINLLRGDMLAPLSEPVDIIVANLPYVQQSELEQFSSLRFEPRLALDGGRDGLDKIRHLSHQLNGRLSSHGCLLLEIGIGQSEIVADLLQRLFTTGQIEISRDLGGVERVISLNLP